MENAKILGTGSYENYVCFVFEKTDNIIDWLARCLNQIFDVYDFTTYSEENSSGDLTEIPKDVNNLKDNHEGFFLSSNGRIDIFYGEKKIFLSLTAPIEKIHTLKSYIDQNATFITTAKK